jgi:RHS repeat-associated protein
VRAALDELKTIDITVPVWDVTVLNGSGTLYHVISFAVVRLTSYDLPGDDRISATYLGSRVCGDVLPTATRTRTPTNTLTPTNTPTSTPTAQSITGRTYTDEDDFDEGTSTNVEQNVPGQLQVAGVTQAFHFIWVAVSTKGTIVKIDTTTGQVLGEYFTSPAGQPRDPSRTTVDYNGNVWAGNRAGNSVVHIGLLENGGCVDRNNNGRIDTSTGLNNILPWTNLNGADTLGGVSTAQDECIIHYTRVSSGGTRHVSVNADNDVWVSGTGNRRFDLIDGDTGLIIRQEPSVGYGGYGGLIDRNGVIWSSRNMLRWDTSLPLTGPNGTNWRGYGHDSYGLCIDSGGNVWNTELDGNRIHKFAPNGNLVASYMHGASNAQGCAIDRNDHVWVAHSLLGGNNTVGHLKPDGSFVGNVVVGSGPTGVSVDAAGKIWATNYNSQNVSRINPAGGGLGPDGTTRVGAVDFTTVGLGGGLYNYSDMTGSTLTAAPGSGTWSTIFDSHIVGAEWGVISWNADVPSGGSLTVTAASGTDGTTFSTPVTATAGVELDLPDGRYLQVVVHFERSADGLSPVLHDLFIGTTGITAPPTRTPTNTPTPSNTPTNTPTSLTPTNTPGGPTNTNTPTNSSTPTNTRTPTPTPSIPVASQGWVGSPANGVTISDTINIVLTTTVTLTSGRIEYWPADDPDAVTVLDPSVSGPGGSTLATLDPSTLANGSYVISLTGTSSTGAELISRVLITVAGQNKPGRITFTVTDLVVPVGGLPINISRTYDSLERSRSGDFGHGWKLAVTGRIEVNQKNDVTITLPNGKRATFYFTPQPAPFPFSFLIFPKYTPEAGTYGSLISDGCGLLVRGPGVYYCFLDYHTYNPTAYQYTDPYGRQYIMDRSGAMRSIKELTGNTLTFTPNGITSSEGGLSVPFVRDGQGRIEKITDPSGKEFDYVYDGDGDLVEVHLPGITTPITYDYDSSHFFLGGTDSRGNRAVTTEYYPDGRLMSVTDAMSNTTSFVYDLPNNITTVTNPDGGTETMRYDPYGMLLSRVDPLGHTTTFTYDARHNQTSSTDPLDNTTTLTYDPDGNVTSVTDPLSNTITAEYHRYGGPIEMTDALSNTWTLGFEGNYLPTSISDSLGLLGGNSFDQKGNIISSFDGNGRETTFVYDAYGNKKSETNPLGHTTTYQYDQLGRMISKSDPLSNTTTYSYDDIGNLRVMTDALGLATHYEYDPNGNLIVQKDPLDHVTRYEYDPNNRVERIIYAQGTPDEATVSYTYDWRGNVLTETDEQSRLTRYEYDLAGQLESIIYAEGTADEATVSYTYDDAGRKKTETNERNFTTTYEYDDAGRVKTVTDALNHVTTYEYDDLGQLDFMLDANNHRTDYTYDIRGRLARTTYHDGTFVQQEYDGAGNVVRLLDQAGKATTYGYDDANRLVRITNPLNQSVNYHYDPAGNLVYIRDANGHQTSFAYDANNRLVEKVLPGGTSEQYGYDDVGNQTSVTLPDTNANNFAYDNLNRLKRIDYYTGDAVEYVYTLTGKRRQVTDSRGTTTYAYDSRDRVRASTQPGNLAVSYTYDDAGNRTTVTTAAGTTQYRYDPLNRVDQVTDPQNAVTEYDYDPVGLRESMTLPNGIAVGYGYDPLNRLTSLTQRRGTQQPFASYTYTLGAAGNRTGLTEANGNRVEWSYDDAYRLTGETRRNSTNAITHQENYAYDSASNRVSSTINGQTTLYTYNALDQIVTTGSARYTYDARGNLTQVTDRGNTTSYTYDAADRLTTAVVPGGSTANYTYDARGRRVSQDVDGTVSNFLWDEGTAYGDVILETDGAGATVASYVYGPACNPVVCSSCGAGGGTCIGAELISQRRGGSASYYLHDGQGSVRNLTDATGNVTDSYTYGAFGTLLQQMGATPNAFRYTAQQFDSLTGLYNMRARNYSPADGRFTTRDPAPVDLGNPVELNRYGYARNNPINFSDPSGLYSTGGTATWPGTTTWPGTGAGAGTRTQPRAGAGGALGEYAMLITFIAIASIPAVLELGKAIRCVYFRIASVVAAVAKCGPCLMLIYRLAERKCRIGICFFSFTQMPTVAAHMLIAQYLRGKPMLLSRASKEERDCNYNEACGSIPGPRPAGMNCDEYPFASSQQGGDGASMMYVLIGDNCRQGNALKTCYAREQIGVGDWYAAVVVP